VDGTWEPYPTCSGDLRETRDGCDGCPGPAGKSRNRTAEAILNRNTASDRRVPKIIANNGERKTIPSFAGNINIGFIDAQKNRANNQQRPRPAARPATTSPPRNFNKVQNQFSQQPQNPFRQQPRQQPRQQQQQPQQIPRQQFQQQPQRQPSTTSASNGNNGQSLSLFEQIKQRINREKQLKNQIVQQQNEKEIQQQQQQQPQQNFRQPQPQQNFRQPEPQQNFRQPEPQQNFRQNLGSFGVFEAVDLSGPSPSPAVPSRSLGSRQAQTETEGFFGVFQNIKLQ
jgi:hypothetical protein